MRPNGPMARPPTGGPSAPTAGTVVEQGHGAPIVFLHGYPLDHEMWGPQVAPFSRDHRVVLVDLPGYGRARDLTVPDTFREFTAAVGRQLEPILTRPGIVVGHSFGGYLALGLYRERPDLFAGLVLTDTRADPDTMEAKQQRWTTARRLEDPSEGLDVEAVARGLVAPATWAAGGALVESVRAMVRRAPSPTVVASLRAIADRPDLGPVLATIRVPTLVLWGADDRLIPPAQSSAMVPRIAGARGTPIEGAGHLPSLENPTAFNAALRAWSDGVPTDATVVPPPA